jgi:hypothetical protein
MISCTCLSGTRSPLHRLGLCASTPRGRDLLWADGANHQLTFRPRGFSPPRRLTPCTFLRACCIPLPIMGFDAFRTAHARAEARSLDTRSNTAGYPSKSSPPTVAVPHHCGLLPSCRCHRPPDTLQRVLVSEVTHLSDLQTSHSTSGLYSTVGVRCDHPLLPAVAARSFHGLYSLRGQYTFRSIPVESGTLTRRLRAGRPRGASATAEAAGIPPQVPHPWGDDRGHHSAAAACEVYPEV